MSQESISTSKSKSSASIHGSCFEYHLVQNKVHDDLCDLLKKVPDQFRSVMFDFILACISDKPFNLVNFAIQYFEKLKKYTPEPTILLSSADVEHDLELKDSENRHTSNYIKHEAVFGEVVNPDSLLRFGVAIMPSKKTPAEKAKIIDTLGESSLYIATDPESFDLIVDLMKCKEVEPGEVIVKEGDIGDSCFVVLRGIFHSYSRNQRGEHVVADVYNNKGFFGDVELLYKSRRTHSVVAVTSGLLCYIDQTTFKELIVYKMHKRRLLLKSFICKVPIFETMTEYEKLSVADSLEEKTYSHGQYIIRQGDAGDGMYFIESGIVSILIRDEADNSEIEVTVLSEGDYFGELSLLTYKPRAASARAVGSNVKVHFIHVSVFERILGSCIEMMKRNSNFYTHMDILFGSNLSFDHLR